MNRLYEGRRTATNAGIEVFCNGEPLPMLHSLKLRNHSPHGPNWGYGGSGPAQLALAILLRETSRQKALELYQGFKRDVIASLEAAWELHSSTIQDWLADADMRHLGLCLGTESVRDAERLHALAVSCALSDCPIEVLADAFDDACDGVIAEDLREHALRPACQADPFHCWRVRDLRRRLARHLHPIQEPSHD